MSWTEDRVEILKKLWGEGHTAAEIAKELGGVTRNAVIGKAHRLKLSNRVSPIQQNAKKKAATAAANANVATTVKPAEKSAPAGSRKANVTPMSANNNVAPAPAPIAKATEKAAPLKPTISESDAKRKRYALTELEGRMCRWPIGDPRDDDFGFCGCKVNSSFPYCDEHTAVAYQAARGRAVKAEDIEAAEAAQAQKAAAE